MCGRDVFMPGVKVVLAIYLLLSTFLNLTFLLNVATGPVSVAFWKRFHLDMGKKCFTLRTISQGNNLPRDMVKSFTSRRVNRLLSNLI